VIAEVYGKKLYSDEIEGLLLNGTTPGDSSTYISQYIDKWIGETLLIKEAEKAQPNFIEIEKLVSDYRNSLLLNDYQKSIFSTVDTVIQQNEINNYYDETKARYQLKSGIMRCLFVKIDAEANDLEEFETNWSKAKNGNEVKSYCQKNARYFLLDGQRWYKYEDLSVFLESTNYNTSSWNSKKSYEYQDSNFKYYLKILDLVKKDNIAPLTFVEDQIRRLILHQRRMEAISDLKSRLYEKARLANQIKLYVD
jgi:hypothetical protein